MPAIPDHVSHIAEQLLPRFIPRDANATAFSFQFTMVPATTYRVDYTKKVEKGKTAWVLVGYAEVVAQ